MNKVMCGWCKDILENKRTLTFDENVPFCREQCRVSYREDKSVDRMKQINEGSQRMIKKLVIVALISSVIYGMDENRFHKSIKRSEEKQVTVESYQLQYPNEPKKESYPAKEEIKKIAKNKEILERYFTQR